MTNRTFISKTARTRTKATQSASTKIDAYDAAAEKLVEASIPDKKPELKLLVQRSIRKHMAALDGLKNYNEKSQLTYKALVQKIYAMQLKACSGDVQAAREETIDRFLDLITDPRFQAKIVLTAHSTEFLTNDAILAEQHMLEYMTRNYPALDATRMDEFIKGYANELKPIPSKKTSRIEIVDSLIGAEGISKAGRYELDSILEALETIGFDHTSIPFDKLIKLKLFHAHSWAWSDNDSRLLHLDWIKNGNTKSREGIYRKYLLDLTRISARLPEIPEYDGMRKLVKSAMWRCIETIENIYADNPKEAENAIIRLDSIIAGRTAKSKRLLANTAEKKQLTEVLDIWKQTRETTKQIRSHNIEIDKLDDLLKKDLEKNLRFLKKNERNIHDSARDYLTMGLKTFLKESGFEVDLNKEYKTIYKNSEQFLGDLENIKRHADSAGIKLPTSKFFRANLLDTLIFEAVQFGSLALKPEYRQTAKAYNLAFKQLVKFVSDEQKGLTKDVLDLNPGAKELTPAILLNLIRSKEAPKQELAKRLREYIKSKMSDQVLQGMHADEFEKTYGNAQPDYSDENKDKFYFMDCLQKLQYFTSHPHTCPILLMAEAQESDDFIRVQFLTELVTDQELKAKDEYTGANVVAALIEYKEQLLEFVNIIKKACENPDFHNVIEQRIKKFPGEIFGMFVCMAAGSDSFKSASSASNPIIHQAFTELRKYFKKEFGHDILDAYMGNGSGWHRNYGHSYLHFTNQGINMRYMSKLFAANVEQSKVINLMKELGLEPEKKLTAAAAVLNFGNRANLQQEANKTFALNIAKHRTRMDSYGMIYNGNSVTAHTVQSTPVTTGSAQEKANRHKSRLKTEKNEDERQQLMMRAIGWGQANNNNGSTALQLFIDLSEVIAENKTDLNADGSFKTVDAKLKAAKRFLESPFLQDSVNRAASYLAMSDFRVSWQYTAAGCAKNNLKVTRINGDTIIISGTSFKLSDFTKFPLPETPISCNNLKPEEITKREEERRTQLELDKANGKKPLEEEYNELRDFFIRESGSVAKGVANLHAVIGAAMIETEAKKTATTITSIFSVLNPDSVISENGQISNLRFTEADLTSPTEQLLKELIRINPEYGTEIKLNKRDISAARLGILEDFKVNGKLSIDLDEATNLHFGALRDVFEKVTVSNELLAVNDLELAKAA